MRPSVWGRELDPLSHPWCTNGINSHSNVPFHSQIHHDHPTAGSPMVITYDYLMLQLSSVSFRPLYPQFLPGTQYQPWWEPRMGIHQGGSEHTWHCPHAAGTQTPPSYGTIVHSHSSTSLWWTRSRASPLGILSLTLSTHLSPWCANNIDSHKPGHSNAPFCGWIHSNDPTTASPMVTLL